MTGVINQMTTSPTGSSRSPALDASGTRLAFVSDADLIGSNPDGNSEIFLLHTILGTITQITVTSEGFSSAPAINADGTRIAFVSSADARGDKRQVLLASCPPTAGLAGAGTSEKRQPSGQ
jgi:Tol biopolymer transport system component